MDLFGIRPKFRIRDFMLNTNKKNPNALSGFFSSHVINPNRSQGS